MATEGREEKAGERWSIQPSVGAALPSQTITYPLMLRFDVGRKQADRS